MLLFSFKYFDADHERFQMGNCPSGFFCGLIREIVRYESFTVEEFLDQNNRDHRHLIDFSSTTEPDGFTRVDPDTDEVWTETAYQFGLNGDAGEQTDWRVHGFVADRVFYVVWFDSQHLLGG